MLKIAPSPSAIRIMTERRITELGRSVAAQIDNLMRAFRSTAKAIPASFERALKPGEVETGDLATVAHRELVRRSVPGAMAYSALLAVVGVFTSYT